MNECKACGRPILNPGQVYCGDDCYELAGPDPATEALKADVAAFNRGYTAALEDNAKDKLIAHLREENEHLRASLKSEREHVVKVLWPRRVG